MFLFNVPPGRRDVGCLPPDFSSTGISWKYYFPKPNYSQHVSYFIEETTIGLQKNILIKSKMRLIL